MGREGNPCVLQTDADTMENIWGYHEELKTEPPNGPAIPLLVIYPKKIEALI